MQKRPDVVIVGGGIAGLTTALNLAQRGLHATLVERKSVLGGNATTVCCKAINGKCQLCGGCLLSDCVTAASKKDNLEVLTETTVTRAKRANGGFDLDLTGTQGPDQAIHTQAIVLATGFEHVDAHTKGPYAYGILSAVTTGEEMERRIKEKGRGAYDEAGLQKVAFIQCVGSRDEHVGRGYCSSVCCRYAMRLARLLKSRYPKADIAIFKMDMQTSGRDAAATFSAATKEGIRFVAGLPAVIRRSTENPQRATFVYDDILAGKVSQEDFDLVVLAVGMQPRRDAAELADLFGINRDPYGYFAVVEDETHTLAPGVFLAGSCQAPRSIAESVVHAQQAAESCYLYLQEKGS